MEQSRMNSISQIAQQLKTIFKEHGITLPLTPKMYEQFAKFYIFLMDYNKKYNLTRLTQFKEVAVKHFVDCIYVAQLTPLPARLMDMGTGPGFPGIPLKIVSPQTRIFLAEGVQKKVEFLKAAREHLGLTGLDIIGRNVDPKMQYPVDGVITRAVELAAATLQNAQNCIGVGGKIILMKTPHIEEEMREAQETMGHMYKVVLNQDYSLGKTPNERKLLIYEKTAASTHKGQVQ